MSSLLTQVKKDDQDFEWYPTTKEIIRRVSEDIKYSHLDNLMDIGAGDGRVLLEMKAQNPNLTLLAIEKSKTLISQMDSSIGIMGTDFWEQTFIDKKLDAIFCNPPYSEFSGWMEKIISEANVKSIYFVVPKRWQSNDSIKELIKSREFTYKVLGRYDFYNAERKARAVVELVKLSISNMDYRRNDPFTSWFEKEFLVGSDTSTHHVKPQKVDVKKEVKTALIEGRNLIEVLTSLYQKEMAELLEAFKTIKIIDPILLDSININSHALCESLRVKINGLKTTYWNELFNNYKVITERLTHASKRSIMGLLKGKANVDFTAGNAYAITMWAIKNAYQYFDSQLSDTFEKLVTDACVIRYKSNQVAFKNNEMCFTKEDRLNRFGKIGLDYRIVAHRIGGMSYPPSYARVTEPTLESRALEFLDDLMTVANNLGIKVLTGQNPESLAWEAGVANLFYAKKTSSDEKFVLMRVKAFKNGNLHIQFNQEFIMRLNVEFGRLKGWLSSKDEAKEELGLTEEEAESCFLANTHIKLNTQLLLT